MKEMHDEGLERAGIAIRAALLLVLAYWAFQMAVKPMGSYSLGLVDMADLVFHEAGHILFLPFGSFMTSLGGSLTQVLIPIVCMVTFLVKNHDRYADDWEAILGALGWLPYDVALGRACHRAGVLVMLGAIAWAGWALRERYLAPEGEPAT